MTGNPEPDDIADPPVPPAALPPAVPTLPETLLPLAQGFCQYLQGTMHTWMTDEHRAVMASLDNVYADARAHRETVLQANEHALYSLANALAKIQEDGLRVLRAPYEMTLQVLTPAGVPLTLTIRQTTPAALLDELTRLETWLAGNGYSAAPREVVEV